MRTTDDLDIGTKAGPAARPDSPAGSGPGSDADTRAAVPVHPAPAPRGHGALVSVSLLWAALLVAAGAVAIRDAAVLIGLVPGPPWLPVAVDAVASAIGEAGGLSRSAALAGAAAALAAAVILLAVAAGPGRRRHVEVGADVTVVVPRGDVAGVAATAARQAPGVSEAVAAVRGGRVRVRASGAQVDARVVDETVTRALAPLRKPPRVQVRTEERPWS